MQNLPYLEILGSYLVYMVLELAYCYFKKKGYAEYWSEVNKYFASYNIAKCIFIILFF